MRISKSTLSPLLCGTVMAEAWSPAVAGESCKSYSLQPKDTCWSIMKEANVTFAQIISWNRNLDKKCSNISELEGRSICISNPVGNYNLPSNSAGIPTIITTTASLPSPTQDGTEARCAEFHLVEDGEDCSTFLTKYEMTLKDFLFLNPQVFQNCTNVWLGYKYCVRPVGYISTYPGYLPTTTSREFEKTPTTKLANGEEIINRYKKHDPVIPIANQTRKNCFEYEAIQPPLCYRFHILTQMVDCLEDCWAIARIYGITPEEFVMWNPSVAQSGAAVSDDMNYAYSCSLAENISYCVALESPTPEPTNVVTAPPSPRAAGEIANCTEWRQIEEWHTCDVILLTHKITVDYFYFMNPTVEKDCTGLTLGTYYCVSVEKDGGPPPEDTPTSTIVSTTSSAIAISTPTPTQSGMVSSCNRFYYVKLRDVCGDIAQSHGISIGDFNKWNPAVKSDCTGLIAEYYVCVGVRETSTTTKSVSTLSTKTVENPNATPTPIQSGMVDNCGEFYFVVEGDGCWAISDKHKIALENFYRWNPAVKDDCSGLLFDFYVCIGLK